MDTSKEYIKMCEKVEEIQRNEKLPWEGIGIERNDYFAHKDGYEIDASDLVWNMEVKAYIERSPNPFRCAVDKRPIKYKKGEIIWLPRQDQLQEMVRDKWATIFGLLEGFYGWVRNCASENKITTSSMEIFWLCFVMHEKYQKTWDGKEWIK